MYDSRKIADLHEIVAQQCHRHRNPCSNPILHTTVGPVAVVWELKKQGRKESTLVAASRKLRYLEKHVDLSQPEKVK